MLTAELVKDTALGLGFDLVGITSAEPLTDLLELLEDRKQKGLQSEFIKGEPKERLNPQALLPGVKSIIVIGFNYLTEAKGSKESLSGRFSRSAWGRDYHQVIKDKLQVLAEKLTEIDSGLEYKIFVDTGPLPERELARRAGLGWFGKNASLITERLGSWVFLGEMLINRKLQPDRPLIRSCGQCVKCLDSCPSGALESPYQVNPNRCLSYLTQKRGCLPREIRPLLDNRLYGCDTCQEACPHNQQVGSTSLPDFFPSGEESLSLEELINISKGDFQKKFGRSAAAWRGKTILQRNAVIALGNSGNPQAVPILQGALNAFSPVIRGHAAWALGRLGGTKAATVLKDALKKEKDPQVREEIEAALQDNL